MCVDTLFINARENIAEIMPWQSNTFVLSTMPTLWYFRRTSEIAIQHLHYFKLFTIMEENPGSLQLGSCFCSAEHHFYKFFMSTRLIAGNMETLLQQSQIGQDQKACKTKWEHPLQPHLHLLI